MSSTNKTPIYDLNQWTLTDKPKYGDFNSDNSKSTRLSHRRPMPPNLS